MNDTEKTLDQLEAEAKAAAIAFEEALRRDWRGRLDPGQAFVADRVPAAPSRVASPNALTLDVDAAGRGCPEYVYTGPIFVNLTGSSGPGLLRVLRALVELEEERERRRQAGEEVW